MSLISLHGPSRRPTPLSPQRARLSVRKTAIATAWAASLPGLAGAACTVTGTANLSLQHCGSDYVQYRADAGSVVLDVSGVTLANGGVDLAPSSPDLAGDTSGGPYAQTVNLTNGTSITNASYSGVIMQSYKADRQVTVTAEPGVSVHSGVGGFGGIWVRNDTSGDVTITSAATVTEDGTDAGGAAINATTNQGNVSVSNAGTVQAAHVRGLYADGGHDNLPAAPVLVSILNDTTGSVTAYTAAARAINYQGLAKIENRGTVASTTRQGLIAWSNNGPSTVINSGTVSSGDDHAIQAATEFGDATVDNSGSVTANDNPAINVTRSGYAAIHAEVDMDTVSTPGVNGHVVVTNQATGVVNAPNDYGIYAATPQGNVTITQAGTSTGQHGLWANAVSGTVTVTNSGTVTANDAAGIGLRVAAATGGTVENSGTITSPAIAIQTDATATLSEVRNLSTGILNGHLVLAGPGAVANAGTLVLPAVGSSSVAGSYTQSYNGTTGLLRIRVNSSAQFGKMAVTGAATLPAGAQIDVRTDDAAGCRAIPAGTTLASVLSAGSLSSSNVVVTDDCNAMNFSAVRNGQAIDLVSALPVQAACGSAANTAAAFQPSANLCLRGTASAVVAGDPWSWSCQGTPGGSDASCTAPNASVTGGGGAGVGRALVSSPPGNTNAWVVDAVNSKGFIATSDPKAPRYMPPGYRFPYGLFDVTLISGDAGTGATVTIVYPSALPAGAVWMKYGKTAAQPTPHWYVFPGAEIAGNTVTLNLVDGGAGDDDLSVNSVIVDPGGPAWFDVNDPSLRAIPTLSQWGTLILGALLSISALWQVRRRRR